MQLHTANSEILQFLLVKSLVGYQESEVPLMASDLRDIAK